MRDPYEDKPSYRLLFLVNSECNKQVSFVADDDSEAKMLAWYRLSTWHSDPVTRPSLHKLVTCIPDRPPYWVEVPLVADTKRELRQEAKAVSNITKLYKDKLERNHALRANSNKDKL